MRLAFAALLLCPGLYAASPEKTAKIQQVFDILKVETISDQISAQLTGVIDRIGADIASRVGIPTDQRAQATADVRAKMVAIMKEKTAWPILKPGMIQIYDDLYTEADLDDILAFFNSATGKKYLANSVSIVTRGREMADSHVKEAGDAVQNLANEWLSQHKINLPLPTTGPTPAPAPAR